MLALSCQAQTIFVNAMAGARLTDDVSKPARAESKRYVVGASVEVSLPLKCAIEVGTLYHRHGYGFAAVGYPWHEDIRERANDWEFPVLLKFSPRISRVQPFAEGGLSPRFKRKHTDVAYNLGCFQCQCARGNGTHQREHPLGEELGFGGGIRCPVQHGPSEICA